MSWELRVKAVLDSIGADVKSLFAEINTKATTTALGFLTPTHFPSGQVLCLRKDPVTGNWPASYDENGGPVYTGGSSSAAVRPTSRKYVTIFWAGPEPSPAIVASGTGGMLDGSDFRIVTP